MATKKKKQHAAKPPRSNRRHTGPLLKWAGGKYVFIRDIAECVPPLANGATYYEPFAGGASLFMTLKPQRARLSDLNSHLMDTYRAVRSNPTEVGRQVEALARRHSKQFYYEVRDSFNRSRSPIRQAARFIYLNKAGFNGVYRVNTLGKFNVPDGNPVPRASDGDFEGPETCAFKNLRFLRCS